MTAFAPARTRSDAELGLLGCFVAVVAWGIGPLFVRAMGVSTPTVVALRFAFGAPTMTAIAYAMGERLTREIFRRALLPGLLFGTSIFIGFAAILRTSVANATLIVNMMPVLVVLVSRFVYRRHVRLRQYVAAGAAMLGIGIVVAGAGSGGGATLTGDLLACVNLVLFTVYFMHLKRLRDEGLPSWALMAAITIVAGAVATPIGLVVSDDLGAVHGRVWWYVVAMVVIPGVLGHGLMTWAQRHLAVTVSSLLTLGSPVVSAVGAWWWLGQPMSAVQCVGAGVVLAALGAIALNARIEAVRLATLSDPPE